MYEAYFGLTGRAFQLNPDPSFFYGSRGHSSAYSYLKFGAYQGEGFIVVTGEIGAGKTTLVRALLKELDPQRVVAAQLVSTQLDENELLKSVAVAFGLTLKHGNKAELIATLEAFFTLLASRRQRALLIVDEAQNLSDSALEELRLLSNFQLAETPLLQSFLVGQPELRDKLLAPRMEQLRQRVIASYHLGPMDESETTGYIHHRLRHVGWHDDPTFDADCFRAIYTWTRGLPRKINLLANRLMLGAYLAERHHITLSDVEAVVQELRREMLPRAALTVEVPNEAGVPSDKSAHEGLAAATSGAPNVIALDPRPTQVPPPAGVHETDTMASRRVRTVGDGEKSRFASSVIASVQLTRPLLYVLDARSSFMKTAPLLRAAAQSADLPEPLLVQVQRALDFSLCEQLYADLDLDAERVCLDVERGPYAARTTDTMRRFETVLNETAPTAVVIGGRSDAALACALTASHAQVPIVRLDAGLRHRQFDESDERIRRLIDQLADVLYTAGPAEVDHLVREGIDPARCHAVGSLLVDTLFAHRPQAVEPADTLRAAGVPSDRLPIGSGYALIVIRRTEHVGSRDALTQVLLALRAVGVHLPMLWPMDGEVRQRIEQFGLARALDDLKIACLPPQGYLELIGLLANARLVMTDSGSIQDECTALKIPCLTLGAFTERLATVHGGSNTLVDIDSNTIGKTIKNILKTGGKTGTVPLLWDGRAAERVVAHLSDWLAQCAASRQGPHRARA